MVQPNYGSVYPSAGGGFFVPTAPMPTALTPNTPDSFTPPANSNNQPAVASKSSMSPWVWAVGGLATLGVIGLVGWAWWKNKNPESATKGVAGAVNQFVTPHKDPNFTGIQPKRSYTEVKELCKQVMERGNEGGACQTMSVLNSLHLYKKLAEIDPTFDESNAANRIGQLLEAEKTRKALKETTFEFLRGIKPTVYNKALANNDVGQNTDYLTQMMPHFISEYAFNKRIGAFHTVGDINTLDLTDILENLCKGDVGILGGNYFKGGHSVSLVGIAEKEQGAIDTLIRDIRDKPSLLKEHPLLTKIHLLIYDQNEVDSMSSIPLLEILSSSPNPDEQKYHRITLFSNQVMRSPFHQLVMEGRPVWNEIETDAFHQHLMNTGNAVFNAT